MLLCLFKFLIILKGILLGFGCNYYSIRFNYPTDTYFFRVVVDVVVYVAAADNFSLVRDKNIIKLNMSTPSYNKRKKLKFITSIMLKGS